MTTYYRITILFICILLFHADACSIPEMPRSFRQDNPALTKGVHLQYRAEKVLCKIPESASRLWVKMYEERRARSSGALELQQIDKEIQQWKERATTEKRSAATYEYWGTSKGSLWVANEKLLIGEDRRFAVAYNGKYQTLGDPHDLLSVYPALPVDAKIRTPFVVSYNTSYDDLIPFLGFYQPGKLAFRGTVMSSQRENNGLTVITSHKKTQYKFFFDTSDNIVTIEIWHPRGYCKEQYTFCDFRRIDGEVSIPGKIIRSEFQLKSKDTIPESEKVKVKTFDIKNFFRYTDIITTYTLQQAEVTALKQDMFDANHPPVGTQIQDDRHHASYDYTDNRITVEQASINKKNRRPEDHPSAPSNSIRFFSIGLLLVIIGIIIQKVVRKRK